MKKAYLGHTKLFYQNSEKAQQYRNQMHAESGWAAFSARRYLEITKEYLDSESIDEESCILDMPCGTGVAGALLSNYPVRIIPMDISLEMMEHAIDQYDSDKLLGFVRADITKIPISSSSIQGAVVLGFMHRVPLEVKIAALSELKRTCKSFVVISFSVDSIIQKFKRFFLKILWRKYGQASEPMSLSDIRRLLNNAGFRINKLKHVAYIASSEIVVHLKQLN